MQKNPTMRKATARFQNGHETEVLVYVWLLGSDDREKFLRGETIVVNRTKLTLKKSGDSEAKAEHDRK